MSSFPVLCITYSEFDNSVGPQLKYSYPPDVLSKEAFEAYSDYVIVSKQLCEKFIVVNFDDMQFLNYSVAIDNSKYDRNTLLFAFGLVLEKGVNTEPYSSILRRITTSFVNLEIESEYLYQSKDTLLIQKFLCILFRQLQGRNEAFVEMQNNNYLALKLFYSPMEPNEIADYDVPVFKGDRIDLAHLPWDISFQHLIPFIDGISHARKISREAGMDLHCVKRSLKLLVFHGALIMTDVFKFSNVYKLHTDSAIQLLSNPTVMHEMRYFAALPSTRSISSINTGAKINQTHSISEESMPSCEQLIKFLLQLQPNRTLRDIILESVGSGNSARGEGSSGGGGGVGDHTLNLEHMNISRVIAYARANGIIKRLHEYPVYYDIPSSTEAAIPSSTILDQFPHLSPLAIYGNIPYNSSGTGSGGTSSFQSHSSRNSNSPSNDLKYQQSFVSLDSTGIPKDHFSPTAGASDAKVENLPLSAPTGGDPGETAAAAAAAAIVQHPSYSRRSIPSGTGQFNQGGTSSSHQSSPNTMIKKMSADQQLRSPGTRSRYMREREREREREKERERDRIEREHYRDLDMVGGMGYRRGALLGGVDPEGTTRSLTPSRRWPSSSSSSNMGSSNIANSSHSSNNYSSASSLMRAYTPPRRRSAGNPNSGNSHPSSSSSSSSSSAAAATRSEELRPQQAARTTSPIRAQMNRNNPMDHRNHPMYTTTTTNNNNLDGQQQLASSYNSIQYADRAMTSMHPNGQRYQQREQQQYEGGGGGDGSAVRRVNSDNMLLVSGERNYNDHGHSNSNNISSSNNYDLNPYPASSQGGKLQRTQLDHEQISKHQGDVGGGGGGGGMVVVAGAPLLPPPISVKPSLPIDILEQLDGQEHLDSLCCRFEITYQDIVEHPGVFITYK